MNKGPKIMDWETDESAPEPVSKSQKKREMLALQQLGARLMALKPAQWREPDLNLNQTVLQALDESLRIKGHGALRRHERRLGKLLREEDPRMVSSLIAHLETLGKPDVNRLHRLEGWRDRLLSEGESALGQLLLQCPGCDAQQLRQLILAARNEQAQGRAPAARRRLFKYLNEVLMD